MIIDSDLTRAFIADEESSVTVMAEWTKERICLTCNATFTLEEHGHFGARGLAESLEAGHALPSPDDVDSIANKCPACNGQMKDVDAGKMFEALAVRGDSQAGTAKPISRKLGGGIAAVGVVLFIVFAIIGTASGEGIGIGTWAFSGLFIFIGLAVIAMAAIRNR